MIRIFIEPDRSEKLTVRMADGRNGRTLLSSTSQGYDRLSRAEDLARRIAPRGDEAVELVIRSAAGKVMRRETLWDPTAEAGVA